MKNNLLKKILLYTLPITIFPLLLATVFYYAYIEKILENDVIDSQKMTFNVIVDDGMTFEQNVLNVEHYLTNKHNSLPELSLYDGDVKMLANNFDMKSNGKLGKFYNAGNLSKYVEKASKRDQRLILHDSKNSLLIKPILEDDKIAAYLVSRYKSVVENKMVIINQTFAYQVFIIIFSVLIISILIVIFSLRLLYPLELLIEGIRNIGKGNLSFKIESASDDEIGMVVEAFNDMTLKRKLIEDELRNMATRDGLTGLYNHKRFYSLLKDEILREERYKRDVSLLMLDIDYFKRVNDDYGHRSGDMILREISDRLSNRVRTIDKVCRYGGEEIAIILPETDTKTAKRIAEDLRILVEGKPFEVEDEGEISITVSIGVATYADHAKDASTLVSAADKALYEAKDSGRNRVRIYEFK